MDYAYLLDLRDDELREIILGPILMDCRAFYDEITHASTPDIMYEDMYNRLADGPTEHVKRMFWRLGTEELTADIERELLCLWIKYHRAKTRHKYDHRTRELIAPARVHGLQHLRDLLEAQMQYGWLIDVTYVWSWPDDEPTPAP